MCFFFNVDSAKLELLTTASLSQYILVGPSTGTLIIHNLYLSPLFISHPTLKAMNFEPNVDTSTVFCCLLYQVIGGQFINMIISDCDFLVTRSLAKAVSVNIEIITRFPLGSSILDGISPVTSP